MSTLIAVGGMLVLTGLALLVALLLGVQMPTRTTPDRPVDSDAQRARTRRQRMLLVAAAVGLGVLLATGWVGAGLGAALVVFVAPSLLSPAAASQRHIARLEALASWTRRLSDLLGSGAAQTLQDALARAAATSPAPISQETRALADRMGPQGLEPALRAFADQVADPVGDHVAMALIVRARHGGVGLAEVLAALSRDVDEQVRMRREVLSEQRKQMSNVRGILGVTLVACAALALFARDYLAPYHTPAGQVALVLVVAGFAATIRWLQRMARPVVGDRFLSNPAGLDPVSR